MSAIRVLYTIGPTARRARKAPEAAQVGRDAAVAVRQREQDPSHANAASGNPCRKTTSGDIDGARRPGTTAMPWQLGVEGPRVGVIGASATVSQAGVRPLVEKSAASSTPVRASAENSSTETSDASVV